MNAKKISLAAAILLALSVIFTGCIPQHYVPSHEDKLKEKGMELIQEYLSENHPSAKTGDPVCLHAVHYTGDYLTDYISSTYTENGTETEIAVDVSTGDIYTSEHYEELNSACIDTVRDTLELDEESIIGTEADAVLRLPPKRDGEVIKELPDYIYVEIRMLPEGITDVQEYLNDPEADIAADITYSLKDGTDMESYFEDGTEDSILDSLPLKACSVHLNSFSESVRLGAPRHDRYAFAEEGGLIIRYPELIDIISEDENGNPSRYTQTFSYGKDIKVTEGPDGYIFESGETSPEFGISVYISKDSPLSGKKGSFTREDGQTAVLTAVEEPLNPDVLKLKPDSFFPLDVNGTLTFE